MTRRQLIAEVERGVAPEEYVGSVVRIPARRVKALPGQPREHFDMVQLRRLQDSIAEIGQQAPATVVPWEDGTFRLRDGERRWRCCKALEIPLLALVVDARSEEEEFELSTVANLNRESHSPLEKARAMKRLRDGALKRSVAQIARTFGVSDQTVYNHLAIVDQLPERVLELMDPSRQDGRRNTLQASCAVRLTALKEFPKEQLRLATRIVREQMPLSKALRAIDLVADAKQVTSGPGRERKPSDNLRTLSRAIVRMTPQVEWFATQTDEQIEALFEWSGADRHEEVTAQLDATIASLTALRDRIASAERIGSRRGLKVSRG